jgi:hypothetical protein
MATISGVDATFLSSGPGGDVVEIALLLPSERVEALLVLAEKRRQSVGQVLRRLIDRALAADE